jgi:hypothetical protein
LYYSHEHDNAGGKGSAAVTRDGEEFNITIASTGKLLLRLEEDMDI